MRQSVLSLCLNFPHENLTVINCFQIHHKKKKISSMKDVAGKNPDTFFFFKHMIPIHKGQSQNETQPRQRKNDIIIILMNSTSIVQSSAPSGAAEQSTRYCVAPWAAFQLSLILLWLSSETRRERGEDKGTAGKNKAERYLQCMRSVTIQTLEETWLCNSYCKLVDIYPTSNTVEQPLYKQQVEFTWSPRIKKQRGVASYFQHGVLLPRQSSPLKNNIGGKGPLRSLVQPAAQRAGCSEC